MLSTDYSKEKALTKLRQRLLDLTGRNGFLNQKNPFESKSNIPFINFDVQSVLNKLLKGEALSIKNIPNPIVDSTGAVSHTKEDWVITNLKNLNKESCDLFEQSPDLQSFCFESELDARALKLIKKNKQTTEEFGVTSLFMVFGLLKYPLKKDSNTQLAPLVVMPVEVYKADGGFSWEVAYTNEDLVENFSLSEKFLQEFNLNISMFFDPDVLSVDEFTSGILDTLKGIGPDCQAIPYLFITSLSSINMLLFNDIKEETWQKQGKHLLSETTLTDLLSLEVYDKTDQLYTYELDEIDISNPTYPLLIEHADSSQVNAILNVVNFPQDHQVIIGPPGTGKSQTITNLISALLHRGRKVLFISEKKAALDIVHQRLAKAGLGSFTLALHNNKTSKKEVIKNIIDALEVAQTSFTEQDLQLIRDGLEKTRGALAQYCHKINQSMPHAASLQQKIWEKIAIELTDTYSIEKEQLSPDFLTKVLVQRDLLKNLVTIVDVNEKKVKGINKELNTLLMTHTCTPEALNIHLADQKLTEIHHITTDLLQNFKKLFPEGVGLPLIGFLTETLEVFTATHQYLQKNIRDINLTQYFNTPEINFEKQDFFQTALQNSRELNAINLKLANASGYDTLNDVFKEDGLSEMAQLLSDLTKEPLDREFKKPGQRVLTADIFLRAKTVFNLKDFDLDLSYLWANVDDLLNCPSLIKFDYSSRYTLNSKYAPTYNKILQLKKDIDKTQSESCLRVLTEENEYEKIYPVLEQYLTIVESPFKYFSKKWYQALSLHKKLQKDISKRYSYTEKEQNLLQLFAVYEKYSQLNSLMQQLPEDCPLFQTGVLFDTETFEYEYKYLHQYQVHYEKIMKTDDYFKVLSNIDKFSKVFSFKSIVEIRDSLFGINCYFLAQNHLNQPKSLSNLIKIINICQDQNISMAQLLKLVQIILQKEKLQNALTIVYKKYSWASDLNRLTQIADTENFVQQVPKTCYGLVHLGLLSNTNSTAQVETALNEQVDCLKVALKQINQIKEITAVFEKTTGIVVQIDFNRFSWEHLIESNQMLNSILRHRQLLQNWALANCAKNEIDHRVPFLGAMLRQESYGSQPILLFEHIVKEALSLDVSQILEQDPLLRTCTGVTAQETISLFRKMDEDLILANREFLKNALLENREVPKGESGAKVKDYTEGVLLKHLKRTPGARITLRDLFSKATRAIQEICPCFLMGPQAVAQYLSPSQFEFDVLIIDEASQMRLEHSLGAIARAKQIIVVGDPEQLGPSSMFKVSTEPADENEKWAVLETESVLSWALAKYKESILNWHYRSKHESLIDFSNKTFYGNKLIVVPSCEVKSSDLGLNYHYLDTATYNDQTNEQEAKAILDQIIHHAHYKPHQSLGVVTLNVYQADCIEKELNVVLMTDPILKAFIQDWESKKEPFFIKNLENVQGDERDVIFISLTFGKSAIAPFKVNQNFGLFSREDGGRRLNVLVTRAKRAMHVFSSLGSTDIRVEPKTPKGTVLFKKFLEHCESNKEVIWQQGTPESPFEVAICDILIKNGYAVTCQLGVAGYRIDIAVRNPYCSENFIAAIECDGKTYHSSHSVKDRDKLRQLVLEERGWASAIYRIWSTDWFLNKELETKKLLDFLSSRETDYAS